MKGELAVSEHFFSVQGEGPTMGRRAVFLRLKSCNLLCGGEGTVFDKKLHSGATWRCDTIEVWLKGSKKNFATLIKEFEELNYLTAFENGAHLVVTGGEPMLQQKELANFLQILRAAVGRPFNIEIETNGTIVPELALLEQLDQINCSPKLANSGVPKEKRFRLQALDALCADQHTIFKFVITKPEDLEEVERDFLNYFPIDPRNIWLMPGASSREELEANSLFCVEAVKKHGFNFSSRLQVAVWNLTTGV